LVRARAIAPVRHVPASLRHALRHDVHASVGVCAMCVTCVARAHVCRRARPHTHTRAPAYARAHVETWRTCRTSLQNQRVDGARDAAQDAAHGALRITK